MGDTPPVVVYVTHRVPYPPDKGDRIRNYHVLTTLARHGRVLLAALADEPVTEQTRAALARHCERVIIVPHASKVKWARAALSWMRGRSLSEGLFAHPELNAAVAAWAAEFPAATVVVSAGPLAALLKHGTGRKVVDLIDVDSQKWHDFAAVSPVPKSWVYRSEGSRLRTLERSLVRSSDAVVLVSHAEGRVYDGLTRPGAATVAVNGVDRDYFRPTETPTVPALAFVGAMDYLPNVDAAVWFAHAVWPTVRARFPQAQFRVVGRNPSSAVQRLAELPGVVVTGGVADVRPLVADCQAAVIPMRLSRGLQNKVLEAMAMGKPVLASAPALAALDVTPGEEVLRCDTPEEWVESIARVLGDAELRERLGRNARQFVEERHDWATCLAPLVEAVWPAGGPR